MREKIATARFKRAYIWIQLYTSEGFPFYFSSCNVLAYSSCWRLTGVKMPKKKQNPNNPGGIKEPYDAAAVFSFNLRKYRYMLNLTQREFGALTGFSHGTIVDLERGSKSVTMDSLSRICAAIKIPLSDMFELPDGLFAIRNEMATSDKELLFYIKEFVDKKVKR